MAWGQRLVPADNASLWAIPVAAAVVVLVWRRLLAYLRYFQQEGYEHLRFVRWTGVRPLTDPAFWLAVAAAWLSNRSAGWSAALWLAGAAVLIAGQPDPRRTGKITLKVTWRATRVLAGAGMVAAAFWLAWNALDASGLRAVYTASALVILLLPLCLIVANILLAPYERSVQHGYEADAVRTLGRVRPFVIGITGSYGKSSTKSMIAHVLQFKGPTLAASGSINTLMGITRHIRENLVFGCEFMIVEMGAYGIGSIRRLCQLTPPSAAIVTAVGDMHLERFGSLENIVQAKSELARALPSGGLLVVNADSPGALQIARIVPDRRVLLYGENADQDLDTRLTGVEFTKQGTSFVLITRNGDYQCFAPIHGRPIILNLAGAFTLARALGVDPEVIVASFRTLKPVSNRLEVVEDRGITWIRDAYNANQVGFRAALEVAASLPVKHRVLVTPGVIELGVMQAEVNQALSKSAAEVCDNTLVVSDTNRDAFVAGHREAGHPDRLVAVPTRTDAFAWIREHVQDGDAVILENDLPDLYERSEGVFWTTGAAGAARP
jgi:UDP-N-acetylmuramoyl-tripeptide--D-alanyl-D-alanine ligase